MYMQEPHKDMRGSLTAVEAYKPSRAKRLGVWDFGEEDKSQEGGKSRGLTCLAEKSFLHKAS